MHYFCRPHNEISFFAYSISVSQIFFFLALIIFILFFVSPTSFVLLFRRSRWLLTELIIRAQTCLLTVYFRISIRMTRGGVESVPNMKVLLFPSCRILFSVHGDLVKQDKNSELFSRKKSDEEWNFTLEIKKKQEKRKIT